MPRIAPNTAAQPVAQNEAPSLNLNDTGDRMREAHDRTAIHAMRDGEADQRSSPRSETGDHVWKAPLNLDAPPERPGYRQRWVRSEFRNEKDNLNWQAKLREGWVPRDPETVPNAEQYFGSHVQSTESVIRVGGLILMEIPEDKLRAKRRAIDQISRSQEQSVSVDTDKVSREGVRSGYAPIIREESREVVTGRRPETLAD